ncbi:MAG: nuclear transport factor 2 family protein [Gemmatimonadota bacterium]|nr:nuclear transport factor 2 family protein [Gemmatimonadota bacterium]
MHRLLLLAATAAVLSAPRAAHAQSADHAAVLATVNAFHAALERGDSAAALRQLAPDVRILESGGLESLADYRDHHLPGDIAFAKAVPSVRAEPTVVVQGDVAWVVGSSRTTGTYRERAINSAGAELMVLSRTAEGWRIRAIHWSSRAVRTP